MEIKAVYKMGKELMLQHGLSDWTLEMTRAVRRFGVCRLHQKTIGISARLARLNDEARVRNTILHEIAHALTPYAGHGPEWKRKALAIGCDGNRTYSTALVITPQRAWTGTCPACHRTVQRHRRMTIACGKCCKGRFDENFKFVWKHN